MIVIVRHQFSLMVLYAVALHYLWAACTLIDRSSLFATALSVFYTHLYLPPWIMPGIFVFVATLSVIALCMPRMTPGAIALMLPQQFTLTMSAWGAMSATLAGHFGDGVVRSHTFILADQAPAILAAIGHTLAIIGMGKRAQWNS